MLPDFVNRLSCAGNQFPVKCPDIMAPTLPNHQSAGIRSFVFPTEDIYVNYVSRLQSVDSLAAVCPFVRHDSALIPVSSHPVASAHSRDVQHVSFGSVCEPVLGNTADRQCVIMMVLGKMQDRFPVVFGSSSCRAFDIPENNEQRILFIFPERVTPCGIPIASVYRAVGENSFQMSDPGL